METQQQLSSVEGPPTGAVAADTASELSSNTSIPTHGNGHETLPPEAVIADILTHRHGSNSGSPRAVESPIGTSPSTKDNADSAAPEGAFSSAVRTQSGDGTSSPIQRTSVAALSSDLTDIDLGPPEAAPTTEATEQLPSENTHSVVLTQLDQPPARAPGEQSSIKLTLYEEDAQGAIVPPLLTERNSHASTSSEGGVSGSSSAPPRAAEVG